MPLEFFDVVFSEQAAFLIAVVGGNEHQALRGSGSDISFTKVGDSVTSLVPLLLFPGFQDADVPLCHRENKAFVFVPSVIIEAVRR